MAGSCGPGSSPIRMADATVCESRSTSTRRCTTTGTACDAALRRFGIDLPYEEQFDWDRAAAPDQLQVASPRPTATSHPLSEPYPGAVETVCTWHEARHFIRVTSHRVQVPATATWLTSIDVRGDHCPRQGQPLPRARHRRVVDDSPTNMLAASIAHRRGDDRAPVEPGGVRDRGRHQRARLADAERAHRPVLARRRVA